MARSDFVLPIRASILNTLEEMINRLVTDFTVFEFGTTLLAILVVSLYIFRRPFSVDEGDADRDRAAVTHARVRQISGSARGEISNVTKQIAHQSVIKPVTTKAAAGGAASLSADTSTTSPAIPPTPPHTLLAAALLQGDIFDALSFSSEQFPPPIAADVNIAQWRSANPLALIVSLSARADLTDGDLASLRGILALDVSFATGSFTGAGLGELGETLRVLHARGSRALTPPTLARFASLQVLDASHANMDAACLAALGTSGAPLAVLSLFGSPAVLTGGYALAPLAKCLTSIDLGYCDVDDAALAPLTSLETVDVSGVSTKGLHGAIFSKLLYLKSLKARNCPHLRAPCMGIINKRVDIVVFGCHEDVVEAVAVRLHGCRASPKLS